MRAWIRRAAFAAALLMVLLVAAWLPGLRWGILAMVDRVAALMPVWVWMILGMVLAVVFVIWIPKRQAKDRENTAQLENEQRRTLIQIIGGVALLVGAYITWENFVATRQNFQATQALVERGQNTDRFTHAIEQLGKGKPGDDNLAIRLGGIYALEQLGMDSPKTYGRPVVEVLTTYVREYAWWNGVSTPRDTPKGPAGGGDVKPQEKKAHPLEDIQTILTVLGRRNTDNERGLKLDLSKTDLQGANLPGANLAGADLTGANLQGANLLDTNLVGVTMVGAALQGATLRGANLQNANLLETNLMGVSLVGGTLQGATLQRANLQKANLQNANLQNADLQYADLENATLQDANLQNTKLQRANLLDVTLQGAEMLGAHLEGASVFSKDLTQQQLVVACLDDTTGLRGTELKRPVVRPECCDMRPGCKQDAASGTLGLVVARTVAATPIVGIAGQVLYYSNNAAVSGATFQLRNPLIGLTAVAQTQSDAAGQYAFTGLSIGTQQLGAEKTGDSGAGISALDAVYVLESLSGTRTLSMAQRLACDVTGNGALSTLDAEMILQYKAGLITSFPVAETCASDWAFVPTAQASATIQLIQPQMLTGSCQPGSIIFNPLADQSSGAAFSAVLFGDCTGNWQPTITNATPRGAPDTPSLVKFGLAQRDGHRFSVPLDVQKDGGFQGLDVEVAYDPAMLSALGARPTGEAQNALIATNTSVPGRIVISLANAARLPVGQVLLLDFTATDARVETSSIRVTHATVE
jgi:uncharacterized protein YjbI with pentapeptide repeats